MGMEVEDEVEMNLALGGEEIRLGVKKRNRRGSMWVSRVVRGPRRVACGRPG